MSVDFFISSLHNMLGNIELNIDTKTNHPAPTSYFTNPSFKKPVLFGNPRLHRNADGIFVVTTACAPILEPASFVRREHGTYHLVSEIPVHISIIYT